MVPSRKEKICASVRGGILMRAAVGMTWRDEVESGFAEVLCPVMLVRRTGAVRVPDADVFEAAVHDVVAVTGAIHPARDDGGRGGLPRGDVFSGRGPNVSGIVDAIGKGASVGAGVAEEVLRGHVSGMEPSGATEFRVRGKRSNRRFRDSAARGTCGAFLIDERENLALERRPRSVPGILKIAPTGDQVLFGRIDERFGFEVHGHGFIDFGIIGPIDDFARTAYERGQRHKAHERDYFTHSWKSLVLRSRTMRAGHSQRTTKHEALSTAS